MKGNSIAVISALLIAAGCSFAAESPREWKSGTLLETEKQQVLQGSTETSNTEGTIKGKDNGRKADYSQTSTTNKSEDYDTFQVYTIQGEKKTYIARERLLFPWSKPANVTVGEGVKFSVHKNTLFLLDDDGKQHKAGISKISMNQTHEP
jgi:hypothetical protein